MLPGPVRARRARADAQRDPGLGADTLRIEVKWSEVAPRPGREEQAVVRCDGPGRVPGLPALRRPRAAGRRQGLPDHDHARPRCARTGRPRAAAAATTRSTRSDFADFARAVGHAVLRHVLGGLPAVKYFSIWNEPNHIFFLKPRSQSPRVYRRLVERGVPALRAAAARDAGLRRRAGARRHRDQGDRAEALHPGLAVPGQELQAPARPGGARGRLQRVQEGAARTASRTTPTARPARCSARRDIINISVIRRLATALDKAARAGRISRGLGIYNTEFGFQTNPPDPFISTSPEPPGGAPEREGGVLLPLPAAQELLAVPALRRSGPHRAPRRCKWAGFQTGLRIDRRDAVKPSYDAYRLPIVVKKQRSGVLIWGRVRPGSGTRFAQLQRKQGRLLRERRIARSPRTPAATSPSTRSKSASYRFIGFAVPRRQQLLGTSRTAKREVEPHSAVSPSSKFLRPRCARSRRRRSCSLPARRSRPRASGPCSRTTPRS